MNIYLLTQDEVRGYDTYDSCVVIADNEEQAKLHSISKLAWNGRRWTDRTDKISSRLLGYSNTSEVEIVCASFNAG